MIRRCSEIDGEQIEDSIRLIGSDSDVIGVFAIRRLEGRSARL
jgi:hypothetical protein